ncbi:hypothetical protein IMCC14465_04350 [alpha proteobacterium IMCC14465]|uniref:Cytochrome c-type biogenesis protein CcmF n=1 Tax=alpha proteobacterium IMCC14465 TaxID=1220535 RepID=J9DJG5_9PROT|nr:hypothetical protein IMCC14465_04350 [alpha proteobacterium IMCC14465]
MITESGHFAMILAFCVALLQSTLPLYGAQRERQAFIDMAVPAAKLQFILLLWAFAVLTVKFVQSDFSLWLVTANSHADKPFIYRLTGVWGNHEGSMLLWILMLAAYGAGIAQFGKSMPAALKARVLGVQGIIGVLFLAFSLFTSNPFSRLISPPFEGSGLNPILQDPALAVHPPLLYAGYVGFSLAFSFSVAALMSGKISPDWAKWVRPWTLLAWLSLTLGIAVGSFWAYYELGWGGFWFWDPVENASFMPWLAGTALLHSALVTARRNTLHSWTMLLAILTFALCIAGTFLVRSGVLTSVHAFATDPTRGVFILMVLGVLVGGALLLFAMRAAGLSSADKNVPFHPVSREGALILNNVFLASATATVFLGTIYPLVIDAFGLGKISVGAPYYNAVFVPLITPLLLLMPIGPLSNWGRSDVSPVIKKLAAAGVLAILGGLTVLVMTSEHQGGAALGVGLSMWLMLGALVDLSKKIRFDTTPLAQLPKKLIKLPLQQWGSILAHGGLGVMILGIIGTTAWRSEVVQAVTPGAEMDISGYAVTFEGETSVAGENYTAEQGVFSIKRGGQKIAELKPEKRFYTVERQSTTEAAILKNLAGHLYIVIADETVSDGVVSRVVRIWYHPLVAFIWIGGLIMALGGVAALTRREAQLISDKTN